MEAEGDVADRPRRATDDVEGGESDDDGSQEPLERHFRFDASSRGGESGSEPALVAEVKAAEAKAADAAGVESSAQQHDDGETGGGGGGREFDIALSKRRSRLAAVAQIFESSPEPSTADASHLAGVAFDGTPLKEWLGKFSDPEEDRRPEFFSKGLRARGVVPAHCPDQSGRMRRLARELEALKRQLAAEASERAELQRREAEVRERELALEAEQRRVAELERERKDYPRPPWLHKLEGTINVGIVGNSGVGKSLLINRLRGLQAGAAGWAPVGVRETTKCVSMYAFPCDRRVRLFDYPGAGTELFPLETYIARMGLRYLDMVIIVTACRFTQTEVKLMEELLEHKVPFLLVRTKVDIDVWNNRQDNGHDEKRTLHQILSELKRNCPSTQPYLLSLRDITAYDFPKFLSDVFPCLQQERSNVHAGWDDAWTMPVVHSAPVALIQGRWHDGMGASYFVQGLEVHVSKDDGSSGTLVLTEGEGKVWWCNRWWIDEGAAKKARATAELRWVPRPGATMKPFVWRWSD